MKNLGESYEKAQTYTESTRLPVGGYVLCILDVKYQEYKWGDVILLSFDIAEGDQKMFFTNQYKSQKSEDKKWKGTYRLYVPKDDGTEKDNWTMRRFKTVISAFEASNEGFHWDWDENKLKDKLIGGIFNNKEYEINGRTGFYTNCYSLVPVDKIRSGDFSIPEDTLLNKGASTSASSAGDGFMNIPDGAKDELPF